MLTLWVFRYQTSHYVYLYVSFWFFLYISIYMTPSKEISIILMTLTMRQLKTICLLLWEGGAQYSHEDSILLRMCVRVTEVILTSTESMYKTQEKIFEENSRSNQNQNLSCAMWWSKVNSIFPQMTNIKLKTVQVPRPGPEYSYSYICPMQQTGELKSG